MRERDEEIVNSPEGLSDLEEQARQRDTKIASLQEEISDLEEDARQRDGEIDTLQHKISDLENHVKQRDEEVDRIFASKGSIAVFFEIIILIIIYSVGLFFVALKILYGSYHAVWLSG